MCFFPSVRCACNNTIFCDYSKPQTSYGSGSRVLDLPRSGRECGAFLFCCFHNYLSFYFVFRLNVICLARLRTTRAVSRPPTTRSPFRVVLGFRALPLSASLKSSASAGGNISLACFTWPPFLSCAGRGTKRQPAPTGSKESRVIRIMPFLLSPFVVYTDTTKPLESFLASPFSTKPTTQP